MAKVVVYDNATGDILRVIRCPDAMAEAQAKTGESVVAPVNDFSGNDTTHKVVDGALVEIE